MTRSGHDGLTWSSSIAPMARALRILIQVKLAIARGSVRVDVNEFLPPCISPHHENKNAVPFYILILIPLPMSISFILDPSLGHAFNLGLNASFYSDPDPGV
ncbi:hypothetical protein EVAR_5789_1 [Eumeta japonica]|uniref:Uncharacterized protein n=1 Tax=Eumeta variegata TaxID=151549 RepID=A0A4C1T5F7_EUMVA|nr:hypothetical protein EVAR_5789_1 [Eumeta japonica]